MSGIVEMWRMGGHGASGQVAGIRLAGTLWFGTLLAGNLLLACPAPVLAAVSADIQHLPFRRSVTLVADARPARAIIEEDSILAAGAALDFADVRLMNEQGEGLALVREPLRRMDEIFTDWRSVPLRWREESNDARWMVIDLGDNAPRELILAFQGPVGNHAITVEGSADSSDWSTLTQRYDINMPPPKDYRFNSQRIALAETRRWLRIRQDSPFNAPSVDDRLDLMLRLERSTPRVSVGYRAETGYARSRGASWEAILRLTGPPRAITRIDLVAADEVRSQLGFQVEARLPEGGWQYVTIDKLPDWIGGSRDSILFQPIRTSEIRLLVTGGDAPNAPIELHALWATPERWTFAANAASAWWLAWGDPFLAAGGIGDGNTVPARPPSGSAVDQPGSPEATLSSQFAPTRLGPPEPNPFHREPGFGLEWLRRRPVVLSVAMVLILALVALVARRPSRTAGSGV